jgi:hypothetical protein
MGFEADLAELVDLLTDRTDRHPEWVTRILHKLDHLEEITMALAQIDQTDLDNFTTAITTQVGVLTDAAKTLGDYIAQLVAGQAAPLPAADESGIQNALSVLGATSSALVALEPPVVTPPAPPVVVTPPATTVTPTAAGTFAAGTLVIVVNADGSVPTDATPVDAATLAPDTLVVPAPTS